MPILGFTVLTGILLTLAIPPLLFILSAAFNAAERPGMPYQFTFSNFENFVTFPGMGELFMTTFSYALPATLMALTLGTFFAWIAERTNVPGRRWLSYLIMPELIAPSIITAYAWILLLSPRIGLINQLLVNSGVFSSPPFNIYSMAGMVWAGGLTGVPFVYIAMSAGFRQMDPGFE